MIRVLYCDDIGAQRRGFEKRVASAFEREFDATCEVVGSYLGFREKLEGGAIFDIVVTDMNFEKAEGGGPRDGLQILRDSKEAWPECEVLLLTAFLEDIEGEDLRALFLELRIKPDHVLSKVDSEDPWSELLELLRVLGRLAGQKQEIEFYRTRAANRSLSDLSTMEVEELEATLRENTRHGMIGRCYGMRKVFEDIDRFAPFDKNVLVTGETGSGKGMVARALHHASRRAERGFNEHNSSTIHENIAEGELFGFAPDSGVANAPPEGRKGVLVATDGGTLFLDEIGDMPISIQAKMLKVIDRSDGTFFPVGSETPTRVDIRFVSATHKNLEEEVQEGNFRRDLLFRLRGVELRVPPLRERKEDIPLLVADQALRFCREYDRPVPRFAEQSMRILAEFSWPGNVRQLQDCTDCLVMALPAGVTDIETSLVMQVLRDQESGLRPETSEGTPTPAAAPATPRDEAREVFDRVMDGSENRTLSHIKRFHGEPVVTAVMRYTLLHFGRYPNDEQAGRLFSGMTANAWRQFAFSHGITLRKVNQERTLQA